MCIVLHNRVCTHKLQRSFVGSRSLCERSAALPQDDNLFRVDSPRPTLPQSARKGWGTLCVPESTAADSNVRPTRLHQFVELLGTDGDRRVNCTRLSPCFMFVPCFRPHVSALTPLPNSVSGTWSGVAANLLVQSIVGPPSREARHPGTPLSRPCHLATCDLPHRSPVRAATQEGGAVKIALGVEDHASKRHCPF